MSLSWREFSFIFSVFLFHHTISVDFESRIFAFPRSTMLEYCFIIHAINFVSLLFGLFFFFFLFVLYVLFMKFALFSVAVYADYTLIRSFICRYLHFTKFRLVQSLRFPLVYEFRCIVVCVCFFLTALQTHRTFHLRLHNTRTLLLDLMVVSLKLKLKSIFNHIHTHFFDHKIYIYQLEPYCKNFFSVRIFFFCCFHLMFLRITTSTFIT